MPEGYELLPVEVIETLIDAAYRAYGPAFGGSQQAVSRAYHAARAAENVLNRRKVTEREHRVQILNSKERLMTDRVENELESRTKGGANGTAHDWECVSPGEYDSLYECRRCGERHMEQADRLGSDRPRFGCTTTSEISADLID